MEDEFEGKQINTILDVTVNFFFATGSPGWNWLYLDKQDIFYTQCSVADWFLLYIESCFFTIQIPFSLTNKTINLTQ